MDADFGRTLEGKICKKCVEEGKRCWMHSGSPKSQSPKSRSGSPKSKSRSGSPKSRSGSPKRRPVNIFTNLPCDVLLNISRNLSPIDFLYLSSVSYEIDKCLVEGRYVTGNSKKDNAKREELKKAKRALAKMQAEADLVSYWRSPIQEFDLPDL